MKPDFLMFIAGMNFSQYDKFVKRRLNGNSIVDVEKFYVGSAAKRR